MESGKITIICPGCQKEISIDDALKSQISEGERRKAKEEFQTLFEAEKKRIWAIALDKAAEKTKGESAKAKEELEGERRKAKVLEQELELQKKKRQEAEEAELKYRKEKLQLEADRKSFELEKQRQLDAERSKIREDAVKTVQDEQRLKNAETAKKLADALKTNEELRRKLEQGSQQMQGEVLELELEETLRQEFPVDEIAPVPKGINGADIIQIIHDRHGQTIGSIAWEMKRTKAWSESWVQKLKDDQRKVKAEIAILVSQIMPSGIIFFGFYEGVYVSTPEACVNLARILRVSMTKIAAAKSLEEGKSEKKEVIYNYLCGPEFRSRVEAIVEATVAAKESLDKEKRAFIKLWAEREKQIDRIETNMVGMYGDMQGIAGRALPQIKSLELEAGENAISPSAISDQIRDLSEKTIVASVEIEPEMITEEKKDVAQQLGF